MARTAAIYFSILKHRFPFIHPERIRHRPGVHSREIEGCREFFNVLTMFLPDGFSDLHDLVFGWRMIKQLNLDIPLPHTFSKIPDAQDLTGSILTFQRCSIESDYQTMSFYNSLHSEQNILINSHINLLTLSLSSYKKEKH